MQLIHEHIGSGTWVVVVVAAAEGMAEDGMGGHVGRFVMGL